MSNIPLIWNCANTREVLPGVATPLSQAVLRRVIDYGARQFMADAGVVVETEAPFCEFHRGRLYLNLNFLMETTGKIPGRSPRNMAATFGFEDMDLLVKHLGIDPDRITPLNLKTLKPMLGSVKYIILLPSIVRKHSPRLRETISHLISEIERADSDGRLLELIGQIEQTSLDATWLHGAVGNFSLGLWESLVRSVEKYFPRPEARTLISRLTSGLRGMVTAEVSLAARDLAAMAGEDAQIREAFFESEPLVALQKLRDACPDHPFFRAWDEFLAKYGHRAFDEPELFHPRWVQDPTYLARFIQGHLKYATTPSEEVMRRQEVLRQEALEKVEKAMSWLDRRTFRFLLGNIQLYSVQRENSKDLWMYSFYALRGAYTALARRWQERGWLKEETDIFFLLPEEIARAVRGELEPTELPSIVRERRAEYLYNQTLNPPETIVGSWEPQEESAVEVVPDKVEPRTLLHGMACSSGTVVGVARVIFDPVAEASRLAPAEIIVTVRTDPMWTTLFLNAGGVVTERGGILSHAAIVAREFGIPAVVGVEGATTYIADGQVISVDGTAGTVEILGLPRGGVVPDKE